MGLQRWGVAIQALIAAVRRPAAQRNRNAAQAVIAAQLRRTTTAREGRTAASRENVLAAPVAGKRLHAVKQSDDALLMIFCSQYLALFFAHNILQDILLIISCRSCFTQSGSLAQSTKWVRKPDWVYPSCKNGLTYLTD